MRLALAFAIIVSVRGTTHASCVPTPSQPVHIVVDKCIAVDKAKGSVLVDGHDGDEAIKVWIPATEKASCAQLKPGVTVTGSVDLACCDGDASPPCTIGTSSVLTGIHVVKPVKQETRAELEAEVEALRAENAQLRAKMAAEVARIRKVNEALDKKLK